MFWRPAKQKNDLEQSKMKYIHVYVCGADTINTETKRNDNNNNECTI